MYPISFMTANFVARPLGYRMTGGWGQGDRATNEHFRPIETFPERFGEMLGEIRAVGFTAVDVWTGHLNRAWATPEHIAAARALLDRHGLRVVSLAGRFGATPEELDAACRLAVALGTDILGGSSALLERDREAAVRVLREHGVRLAIENHPERTPEEMLAKVGDGAGGVIGTAVDTGWYGTHGYDAARAIERLGEHVLHIHLKDVTAVESHTSCRYGEGVVPLENCVRALGKIDYAGAISVEHEPDDHDPTEDVRASLATLRGWLETIRASGAAPPPPA